MSVVLPVGQAVRIIPADMEDMEFSIFYDQSELSVAASMPGNVCGDEGIIYLNATDD